ncbi:uncharacterized protein PSFLO_06974 [Pseudozyma flocculosa]|uniref:Uncharacterized protein n=1 Tax=Pseudozyma flocculosa TaxID=84751 RepID=A0A5C3FAQ9_9BASI|nr:uncharacterized protein PSFLO_06974 [Pseudozyma flocculosa]
MTRPNSGGGACAGGPTPPSPQTGRRTTLSARAASAPLLAVPAADTATVHTTTAAINAALRDIEAAATRPTPISDRSQIS